MGAILMHQAVTTPVEVEVKSFQVERPLPCLVQVLNSSFTFSAFDASGRAGPRFFLGEVCSGRQKVERGGDMS